MRETNSEMDKALVDVRETLPRLWWNVYQGSLQAGFTQCQSFSILLAYVMGYSAGRVGPSTNQNGPESDLNNE